MASEYFLKRKRQVESAEFAFGRILLKKGRYAAARYCSARSCPAEIEPATSHTG